MVRERKGERPEHEERTYAVRVKDVPGLLSRVEALFRRQRVPLRTVFFERELGTRDRVRLTIVVKTSEETFGLLGRQLLRLHDVSHVAEVHPAASVPSFALQERTA